MGAVTEVVAHRGSSADVPEHTLAAYEQAVADGADALECDVRLTADGHLVCVHDRRIDRTSDGRGIVSTMTLSDLDGLDFGAWYAEQREARERADADAALRKSLRPTELASFTAQLAVQQAAASELERELSQQRGQDGQAPAQTPVHSIPKRREHTTGPAVARWTWRLSLRLLRWWFPSRAVSSLRRRKSQDQR